MQAKLASGFLKTISSHLKMGITLNCIHAVTHLCNNDTDCIRKEEEWKICHVLTRCKVTVHSSLSPKMFELDSREFIDGILGDHHFFGEVGLLQVISFTEWIQYIKLNFMLLL